MGYVVAFNRDRDFYQVPLALGEHGLLSGLVTDLYYPDSSWLRRLPGMNKISHRRVDGLRSDSVKWNLPAIAWQILGNRLHFNPQRIYQKVDPALSRGALHLARERSAHLFLYSGYALEAFTAPAAKALMKGLFTFHPHPLLNREILQRDLERYPECAWSYANEADTATPRYLLERLDGELRHADFMVVASTFTKKSLIHAGYSGENIHVVPYGIDTAAASFHPESKSRERCRFLFVGQGIQRKGLHHLLRAWREIDAADAELFVIASSLDPGIAALADRRVKILPRQSPEALRRHFAQAHVFVMPSLIEGFGFVYGEALSAGAFVIGTENTGLPDLVPPDNIAFITAPGDIGALTDALHRTLNRWRTGTLDASMIRAFAYSVDWKIFRDRIGQIARRYHP